MDLREYARVVRRRWVVIVAWVLAVALVAAVYAATRPAEYAATARLVVATPDSVDSFGDLYQRALAAPDRDLATRAQAILSAAVLDAASSKVGRSSADIAASVAVAPVGMSNVLVVTATDTDAKRGADTANAVAEAYIDELRANQAERTAVVRKILESELADAKKEFEQASQAGSEAERLVAIDMVTEAVKKLQALEVLENSEGSDTLLLAAASPAATPSGANPLRSGLLGATLGLVLGLMHAFTLEYLDQRLRSCDEAAELLGVPLLAGSTSGSGPARDERRDERDAYWLAARGLGGATGSAPSVLALADVDREAGVDIAEFARMLHAQGSRVALVSARFGDAALTQALGTDSGVGLSDVLEGRASLSDSFVAIDGDAFGFLPAGSAPASTVMSLGGVGMQQLLAELKERAEIVLLGMPALSDPGAEAAFEAIGPYVDEAVLGVRCGRSTRPACSNARALLDRTGTRAAGVIVLPVAR